MNADLKYFIQGFCSALAFFIKTQGINTEHKEAWKECGLSIEILEAAQVDDFDLEILKAHFKTNP